jgi:hypothetical protein
MVNITTTYYLFYYTGEIPKSILLRSLFMGRSTSSLESSEAGFLTKPLAVLGLLALMGWPAPAAIISFSDLHPSGTSESFIQAVNGSRQAGYFITSGGKYHAALWSEAATSFAVLNPSGAADSVIHGNSLYFSDPQWTNYPGRFYRLRSP